MGLAVLGGDPVAVIVLPLLDRLFGRAYSAP
jgi:hypothetical protein